MMKGMKTGVEFGERITVSPEVVYMLFTDRNRTPHDRVYHVLVCQNRDVRLLQQRIKCLRRT